MNKSLDKQLPTLSSRNQSTTEFRNKVHEVLDRHDSIINQFHATMQIIITELQ